MEALYKVSFGEEWAAKRREPSQLRAILCGVASRQTAVADSAATISHVFLLLSRALFDVPPRSAFVYHNCSFHRAAFFAILK